MQALFLALSLAFGGAAAAAPALVEGQLAARLAACTVCHGQQGRAAPDGYHPRIAGKPAGYLLNQLRNFRDGRRRYGPMVALVDPLADDDLREIAAHFAALNLPYAAPPRPQAPPAVLARGRQLALQGDAARGLPSCAACHGPALTGRLPATPGLLGLPRDYLSGQLGAWRSGQRQAHAPDCMAEVVKRLPPDDLHAVVSWLASQPVPAGGRPAAAPAPGERGPLACASGVAPGVAPASAIPAATAVTGDAAQIERGRVLALAGHCAGCHTARGGAPYAGGRAIATPFGTVYAGNLTPDAAAGLGAWTADDFWRALHHGRGLDGRRLVPAFPYTETTRITRADSDALYAWLRTLPAVTQPNRPHELRWPYGTPLALAAWQLLFFTPGVWQDDARQSAEWNRGAYLVNGAGHCVACHGGRNALGAKSDAGFDGGLIPARSWYAPAFTRAGEASVADWPLDEIVALLRDGVAPRGRASGPMAEVVMGSTQHLPPADLRAMAVYLKSLPVEPRAPPPRHEPPDPARADAGARLYDRHCAGCHGTQGEGGVLRDGPERGRQVVPALAGNRIVTMDPPVNLMRAIMRGGFGAVTAGNPRPHGMPPFAHVLGDAQIADIVTWLRARTGAGAVTAFDVARWRGGTDD